MTTTNQSIEEGKRQVLQHIAALETELVYWREHLSYFDKAEEALRRLPNGISIPTVATPTETANQKGKYYGVGLTDAIKDVFRSIPEPMTQSEIRAQLRLHDFVNIGEHFDVSVATAIKRLIERGVVMYSVVDGKRLYQATPGLL